MERQFYLNWSAFVQEAKQRRAQQRLTQQKLALLAEVSTPTISRFENGAKDIQLSSILSILNVLGMLDHRLVSFSEPNPSFDPNRNVVMFWGQEGEQKIKCAITIEALLDHYQSYNKKFIKIFENNQTAIEHEVRRKYLRNQLESDHSVLITSKDLI